MYRTRDFQQWSRILQQHHPLPLIPSNNSLSRRSLIFHCFPKLGTDWRAVCLSTFRYRDIFNGRIIVSIVMGNQCERPRFVSEWFAQFGSEVETKFAANDPKAGINTTFRSQLRAIQHEPGIVFKAHTKGISHKGDLHATWRNNMAKGCLSNIPHVEQKFREGYRTYGAYKSFSWDGARVMGQISGPCRTTWPGWHYPGAFFWFDPKFIPNSFFELPLHHYENESFPCHIGPSETGFSLTPDNLNYQSTNALPYFKRLNTPL